MAHDSDLATDLQRYLQQSRESLLGTLDGLSEYDVRRPLTPSGTNLLGLIKHLTGLEAGYLGECVGRPVPGVPPWDEDESIWQNGDMWAKVDESRDTLIRAYRTTWVHADAVINELPLSTPAEVEWWPEDRRRTTLGHLLVRMVAETAQHAGHADILREGIDGRTGSGHDQMGDKAWWTSYVAGIQEAAEAYR
ncbi:DinB family protein [Luteipulveratus mongoliensis]|uniref:DinB-like protein, PF04978 family n=1 Tax=Luteipulveratus mongoliensis TaxID=571913 RepID=A0A0K1JJS8_9MICO|nr:DinB family protein [Luteipulveratus mongoliensis]AKU16972.1 hypothetical protein VV02_15740 [Luteipulveratus mongoliensis]